MVSFSGQDHVMNPPFAGSSFSDKGQVLKGQPPIIGDEGGSVFLTRDAYIW